MLLLLSKTYLLIHKYSRLSLIFIFMISVFLSNPLISYSQRDRTIPVVVIIDDKPKKSKKRKRKRKRRKRLKKHSLGLKLGISVAGITSSTFNIDPGVSIIGLVSYEAFISKFFALEIDLGYHTSSFSSGSNDFSITYLALPVTLKFYFSRYFMKPKTFEFWAGPGFELRFRLKDKGMSSLVIAEDRTEGILLAAGAKWYIGKDISLTGDLRYYFGINKPFTTTAGSVEKYREFMFLVGVSYDLF